MVFVGRGAQLQDRLGQGLTLHEILLGVVILGRYGAYIIWEEDLCGALRNCAEGKAQPRVDMAIRTNNGVGPAERQENLCSTERSWFSAQQ